MSKAPLSQVRTLADLVPGESSTVVSVAMGGALALRLQEMGFVAATKVTLIRRAPLGDPLQVQVRGYHVSVRIDEAKLVAIAPAGASIPMGANAT
jgi:ferrous iron transport protein A